MCRDRSSTFTTGCRGFLSRFKIHFILIKETLSSGPGFLTFFDLADKQDSPMQRENQWQLQALRAVARPIKCCCFRLFR